MPVYYLIYMYLHSESQHRTHTLRQADFCPNKFKYGYFHLKSWVSFVNPNEIQNAKLWAISLIFLFFLYCGRRRSIYWLPCWCYHFLLTDNDCTIALLSLDRIPCWLLLFTFFTPLGPLPVNLAYSFFVHQRVTGRKGTGVGSCSVVYW